MRFLSAAAGSRCRETPIATAPLAAQTRRTYVSKVRQYLAWLASAQTDGDPMNTCDGRDGAVRDYRTHLQAVLNADRRRSTTRSRDR